MLEWIPAYLNTLKHTWNAFRNKDPTETGDKDIGVGYGIRPDRLRMHYGVDRSIVTSLINRIAIDAASCSIRHGRMDENGNFVSEIDSHLNYCLKEEANIDQSARAFFQDVYMSMCDEGVVAIVPVETTINPSISSAYDILNLRTGKVVQWYPQHVRVQLYNEKTGQKEEVTLPKKLVALPENPLYSVMNEPNSTLKRLTNKLNLLDVIDNQNSSGRLDLIVQLPYILKGEARQKQAEQRRKDLENQLANSKYGIGYTDGTEKITQLNRPVENQLMSEVEYLTNMLYDQIGMTQAVFDGSADEKTLLNYNSRTIEPMVSAVVDEMNRKFLTKTARSQRQKIWFFKEPFKLVPLANIADIADKFTRNEILSANEVRQIIGMKPSDDPSANELRNKNMPIQDEETKPIKIKME